MTRTICCEVCQNNGICHWCDDIWGVCLNCRCINCTKLYPLCNCTKCDKCKLILTAEEKIDHYCTLCTRCYRYSICDCNCKQCRDCQRYSAVDMFHMKCVDCSHKWCSECVKKNQRCTTQHIGAICCINGMRGCVVYGGIKNIEKAQKDAITTTGYIREQLGNIYSFPKELTDLCVLFYHSHDNTNA